MRKIRVFIIIIVFLMSMSVSLKVQANNVVLKILIANPSETQKKTVPCKVYLPKEVSPQDIVNKNGFEIGYDTQKGCCYVYKKFKLEPGQTLIKEIEIKDIWKIPEEEINSLLSEAKKLTKLLENTEFYERARFLKNSIETKLNEIVERQKTPDLSPDEHISKYRNNLQLLESVKSDLQAAKSLLNQVKPLAPSTTWKLIIGIVAFLGLLGLGYFFVWYKQAKSSFFTQKPKDELSGLESELVEQKKTKEEKKITVEDIEKKLLKKKEPPISL